MTRMSLYAYAFTTAIEALPEGATGSLKSSIHRIKKAEKSGFVFRGERYLIFSLDKPSRARALGLTHLSFTVNYVLP